MHTERFETLIDCLDNYTGEFCMDRHSTCIMGVMERIWGITANSRNCAEFLGLEPGSYGTENFYSHRALFGMPDVRDKTFTSQKHVNDILDFLYYEATAQHAARALRNFMDHGNGALAWIEVMLNDGRVNEVVLEGELTNA